VGQVPLFGLWVTRRVDGSAELGGPLSLGTDDPTVNSLDRLTTKMEQTRRPWWRRLIGR
jgi:hypothetical protein